MRKLTIILFALALGGTCMAQQWELGAAGGLGVYTNLTVTNATASATAGLKPNAVVGVFVSQDMFEHLGGQIRYNVGFNSLKLSSGGTDYSFSAMTHAVNYDLLFFLKGRDTAMRPFISAGGGAKLYWGTGKEIAIQPLVQFAALTKTRQIEGMASIGAGLKWKVGDRTFVTAEIHDYITPAPKKVIAPIPGSKLAGWLHEITPMVGVSWGL